MSENCKSLVLQDKCNIEIFLSPVMGYFSCACCCLLTFFFEINLFNKSSRNTIRVSNSLDPDQDQCFVSPDLGTNCLQRLPVDNKTKIYGFEYSKTPVLLNPDYPFLKTQ